MTEYLSISRLTGNHLAECYAPYIQGNIALQRGDFDRADVLIDAALQVAQSKGWARLIEIGRLFLDLLKIHRGMSTNLSTDILAGVEDLAKEEEVSEGLDGETYACWALGLTRLNRKQEAAQVIRNGREKIVDGNPQDEQWLNLVDSYFQGNSLQPALNWFEQHGFLRVVHFAEQLR